LAEWRGNRLPSWRRRTKGIEIDTPGKRFASEDSGHASVATPGKRVVNDDLLNGSADRAACMRMA
jgi:hypothetical protein